MNQLAIKIHNIRTELKALTKQYKVAKQEEQMPLASYVL